MLLRCLRWLAQSNNTGYSRQTAHTVSCIAKLKKFTFLDAQVQLDEEEVSRVRPPDRGKQEECLLRARYTSMLVTLNGIQRQQDERERQRASQTIS